MVRPAAPVGPPSIPSDVELRCRQPGSAGPVGRVGAAVLDEVVPAAAERAQLMSTTAGVLNSKPLPPMPTLWISSLVGGRAGGIGNSGMLPNWFGTTVQRIRFGM